MDSSSGLILGIVYCTYLGVSGYNLKKNMVFYLLSEDLFTFTNRGILPISFFSHQHISQRAARTSLEKQLDPRGPITLLQKGVRTRFSKETHSYCDFPRGGGGGGGGGGGVSDLPRWHTVCFRGQKLHLSTCNYE